MDAFYAAVEQRDNPALRGRPVLVGGQGRRGVVTTASYEARVFGCRSAMPTARALRLCPGAIVVPMRMQAYIAESRRIREILETFSPDIEPVSIDEAFVDVSGVRAWSGLEGGERAARKIRQLIRDRTGLTASVGVSVNKFLAKVASDLDKPDGLTVLTEADLASRIWPLPVRRINGIGPKAGTRLESMGIRTIAELAAQPRALLVERFGRAYGRWLYDAAHGIDDRPVVTHSEPVSMSRETTFDRDLHARADRAELGAIFTRLAEQLAADLARKGYRGRTIGIKLRFDDFRTVTRDLSLDEATDDAAVIRRAAGQCLKRVDLSRRLRLLGVRVAGLARPGHELPAGARRRSAASAGQPPATAAAGPARDDPELPLFE